MINEKKLQEIIGFTPHEKQDLVINCEGRQIVICAGRRFGKSAISAYFVLKTLLEPNKKIWIVAPTYDLTQKVFDYVVRWYMKVAPSQAGSVSYRPVPRIRTPSGTLLEGKSTENPTGLLGEEVDLLIVDEASRIPRHIFDTYLYPVTSSRQGRMIIISTPFGKNWFYEKWIESKEKNSAFQFQTRDNPFFPPDEWEYAKEKLPEQVFNQEYRANFLEDAASVFRGVQKIISKDCYEDARGDRQYVLGVDLAKLNDFTVLTVMDTYSHKVVHWERFKEISYPLQKARIKAVCDRYRRARIIIDSTGLGDPIVDDLMRSGYLIEDIKLSNKSKQQLIEKLSMFIETKSITIPDESVLVDELGAYAYDISMSAGGRATWKFSAPTGLHDDAVISLAMAVWGLRSREPRKEKDMFHDSEKKNKIKFLYK